MEAATSPVVSPISTSPTTSYHAWPHRRTSSSLSSNHDRSPVTPRRLSHRFSNMSNVSGELSPVGGDHMGNTGNLADELGQLDDDDDFEEGMTEATQDLEQDSHGKDADVIRDSGIDVSYATKRASPGPRNFSKPFGLAQKPPDDDSGQESDIPPELEDALNNVARMTSYTSTSEDTHITRIVASLQDLGNQTSLEAGAQRLTTSTNSLTAHLLAQTKSLQSLSTSLLSPFTFGISVDLQTAEEIFPLVEELLQNLPIPDPAPLQGLQKLERDNANVIQTLSQLTDTLQMGKQATNSAARHLRTTQNVVVELRRERERAEQARQQLQDTDVENRLKRRQCAQECKDVLSGFEAFCDSLRQRVEQENGVEIA